MVAFEFVNHTEVSLIPSRYEEEQIRKQAAEIARKSYEIASLGQVLLTETHRFYMQQPVQSVICEPAIHTQISVSECCTLAARLFGDGNFYSDK